VLAELSPDESARQKGVGCECDLMAENLSPQWKRLAFVEESTVLGPTTKLSTQLLLKEWESL
jgi:hypothetical protein